MTYEQLVQRIMETLGSTSGINKDFMGFVKFWHTYNVDHGRKLEFFIHCVSVFRSKCLLVKIVT